MKIIATKTRRHQGFFYNKTFSVTLWTKTWKFDGAEIKLPGYQNKTIYYHHKIIHHR
jgi:hypothetical protein